MLQLRLHNNKERGSFLVEIVIVIFIIVGALAAILALAVFSLMASRVARQTTEATALASEEMEAVRNYRDGTDWLNDDPGIEYDGFGILDFDLGPFYLEQSGDVPPRWRIVAGSETINGYTRRVFFENLKRDGDGNFTPVGTIDLETVEAHVRISWQDRGTTRTVQLSTYLTNWRQ